jgi:hypothetical protein
MEIRKSTIDKAGYCMECNESHPRNKTIYWIAIGCLSIRLCHHCLCVLSDELEQIATGLKHD